jgi:hypothetical protein
LAISVPLVSQEEFMGTLLIILLVLLLLGGGGGYYGYSRWGASGGIGIFGLVLIILLIAFGGRVPS